MRDTDRRVKYTKMVLRESLLELLQDKPINRISVTELCQNADVNRGTFYAHYSEPYDLLKQIEDELFEDIRRCFEEKPDNTMEETNMDLLLVINRNRELCRIILSDSASPNFMSRVYDVGAEYFRRYWKGSLERLDMPEDYLYRSIVTGNVELIRYWIMNDDNRSPEDIAAMMSSLVNRIMQAYRQK